VEDVRAFWNVKKDEKAKRRVVIRKNIEKRNEITEENKREWQKGRKKQGRGEKIR
jgi:hypothetical protein